MTSNSIGRVKQRDYLSVKLENGGGSAWTVENRRWCWCHGELSVAKDMAASAQCIPAVSGYSETGQGSNTQCEERRRQCCDNTQ